MSPQTVRMCRKNKFCFNFACKYGFQRGASLSHLAFFSDVKIAGKNASYFSHFLILDNALKLTSHGILRY